MAARGQLSSVPEVELDPNGTFKYILVRVQDGPDQCRDIGYGKADHSVTVEILRRTYKDYEIIWSDDKK